MMMTFDSPRYDCGRNVHLFLLFIISCCHCRFNLKYREKWVFILVIILTLPIHRHGKRDVFWRPPLFVLNCVQEDFSLWSFVGRTLIFTPLGWAGKSILCGGGKSDTFYGALRLPLRGINDISTSPPPYSHRVCVFFNVIGCFLAFSNAILQRACRGLDQRGTFIDLMDFKDVDVGMLTTFRDFMLHLDECIFLLGSLFCK